MMQGELLPVKTCYIANDEKNTEFRIEDGIIEPKMTAKVRVTFMFGLQL